MNLFDIDTTQLTEVKLKKPSNGATLGALARSVMSQPTTHTWILGEIPVQGMQIAVVLVEWFDPINNTARRLIIECDKGLVKFI